GPGRTGSPRVASGGIQTPLTCGLTCSELVFDNRRGGKYACGNRVDADGAAWAVRGSRDFWTRRSGTETREPTDYPRAKRPRDECLGAGGAAGVAGVARTAAAGASSWHGGGGGGVRPAVPGAGRRRVGGRGL